jgi:hypothetical protein
LGKLTKGADPFSIIFLYSSARIQKIESVRNPFYRLVQIRMKFSFYHLIRFLQICGIQEKAVVQEKAAQVVAAAQTAVPTEASKAVSGKLSNEELLTTLDSIIALALPFSSSATEQKLLTQFCAGSMQAELDAIDLSQPRFASI